MSSKPLRVLQSFAAPTGVPGGNPFTALMVDSLPRGIEVQYMTTARYVVGGFDVLHVHWPEDLLRARSTPRRWIVYLLFAILLLRTRVRGRRIVRTLHNLAPHESGTRAEAVLLKVLNRFTDFWIYLNPAGTDGRERCSATVLHGHYRQWFSEIQRAEAQPGRLLTFGQMRPYKGTETLIDSLRGLEEPNLTLTVAGRPSDPTYGDSLKQAVAGTTIELILRAVPDPELAELITRSEIIVLPYTSMYNSGALLLALSLDRPTIVPRSPTTELLAREVGPGWVTTYAPPLSSATLLAAVEAVRLSPRTDRPDLSARDWPALGQQLAAIYAGAAEQGEPNAIARNHELQTEHSR
jgi:beta-1,4-mannosyltransferase